MIIGTAAATTQSSTVSVELVDGECSLDTWTYGNHNSITSGFESYFNSNVKGPLFLSKACYPLLLKSQGTIINLVDIHADKPLKNYPVYSMAKAANKMINKQNRYQRAKDKAGRSDIEKLLDLLTKQINLT